MAIQIDSPKLKGMFKEALVTFSLLHGVNSDDLELSRFRLQLEPQTRVEISDKWALHGKIRGFVDVSQWPHSEKSQKVRDDEGYDFSLRQLYLEWSNLPLRLRLGTQSVVWGEALHYFSADVLHPKDYRDGFLNQLEWARIPQTGIHLAYDSETVSFQFIYFPFSQVNRYPKAGAEFSVARYSPESFGLTDVRDESLFKWSEPTLGMNLGVRVSDFEVHAIAAMMRDPQFFIAREAGQVLRRHDRIVQTGLTLSWARDVWLIRAESLWSPRRTVNTFDGATLSSRDVGEVNSILSLEWSKIDNVILALQGYWNQRYLCSSTQILPCRTLQEGFKALVMNLPYEFEFESNFWAEAKGPSFWLSNHLRKSLDEHLRIEVMVEQFFGRGNGVFAEWSNRDQVWTRLEWTF